MQSYINNVLGKTIITDFERFANVTVMKKTDI